MIERRAIEVRGTVQGVGFRPFVYGLAMRLALAGWVRNEGGGVRIEVEGKAEGVEEFLKELQGSPPPLARVVEVSSCAVKAVGERGFRIEASSGGAAAVNVSPDVATCPECLAEMLDSRNRRWRYPFLNCTHCGPRLTIVTGAPYDRARTTMAGFPMCPACKAEYDEPTNRRFHAQPTACAECGPRMELLDASGKPIEVDDAVAEFARAIMAGKIGAMKGLGGFHLVCDAGNEQAVAELRRRKRREERALAIMVGDMAAAERLCWVDEEEKRLLGSEKGAIVLLRRKEVNGEKSDPLEFHALTRREDPPPSPGGRGANQKSPIAAGVAPGNPYLGVMAAYTPLHHLLMDAVAGRPLVMTSGNRSDEPIAYENEDALARLAGIADLFLIHNRPIHVRCDDSVTRMVAGQESLIRRSRGYAPAPIALPVKLMEKLPGAMLAVGGQLKNTFALGQDGQAILSQHMGDLDHFEAFKAFERDIGLFQELFAIEPRVIVHDLHPDYASTRYAKARAKRDGLRLVGVQHHEAHIASCMAEHQLLEPVIGVSFDGTGFGTDGAIWGGEFFVGDYAKFERVAHLRYVAMPGGEAAIHEPWRMALAHRMDADGGTGAEPDGLDSSMARTITVMIERGINSPLTSSAGRLFDAVASLAGVRHRSSYEGQAAMELEWLATGAGQAGEGEAGEYPFAVAQGEVDTRPLIRAVVQDREKGLDAGQIARRFHATMAAMIVQVCRLQRAERRIDAVALSGGVFMNALLVKEAVSRLRAEGFRVFWHKLAPTNDGGLSLGQLAIAAARGG